MLCPIIPSSFIQNRSRNHENQKGFNVKLLPEAKMMKRYSNKQFASSIEKELYELRRCFKITFQIYNLTLNTIGEDCIFYFICAFGTKEDYEKFVCLSTFRSYETPEHYHKQAIYLALKYGNIKLIYIF